MPRIRLPLGRSLLFVCLLLIALIALFPLSLALGALGLGSAGLTGRSVAGSVWLGTMRDASLARLPLGDVGVALDPFPLFVGRARFDMRGPAGRGAVSVGRYGNGIDDVTAHLSLGRLFAPVPLEAVDLGKVSVAFRSGSCVRAAGHVRATFAGDVAGLSLAQGLAGDARCEGGALLLPLVGQSGLEKMAVRITSDGHYRAEFSVTSTDPALAAALSAAGFEAASGGYVLRVAGTLT